MQQAAHTENQEADIICVSTADKSNDGSCPSQRGATSDPERQSIEQVEKAEATASRDDPTPANANELSKLKTTLLILALCFAVFTAALDVTIISTALPVMSTYFRSSAGFTWIGSAYLLAMASSTPVWAKVSDIFGRKPMLLTADVVFFAGSLMAALANSIDLLISARVLQGIGAGGILSLVMISIGDLFSLRARGLYLGITGFTWMIASTIGPLLGGAFAEKLSWRWCFFINLPFQGIAFVIIVVYLKLHTPKTQLLAGLKAIDCIGCLLIVGGTVMFLLGLELGGARYPWNSALVLCMIIFGILTLFLFALNEWKLAKYPILPLYIFQQWSNVACLLVCFSHAFVVTGSSFYLPLYFQAVLGKSPVTSGLLTLSRVVALSVTSMLAGIAMKRTAQYLHLIWGGSALMTIGVGLLIDLDAHSSLVKVNIYQFVAGLGMGVLFQPPALALQSFVPPSDVASAVAITQLFRNIAMAISVVIGAVFIQNEVQRQMSNLVSHLGVATAERLAGFNIVANIDLINSLSHEQKIFVRDIVARPMYRMWILYLVVSTVGMLCGLVIHKQSLKREHQITRTGLEAEEERRLEREDLKNKKG